MWRESAAKRSYDELNSAYNGGKKEGTLGAHQENANQVISYKVDWAEQWPRKGKLIEQGNRITIKGDDEWQIWRYNDKKREREEKAAASTSGMKDNKTVKENENDVNWQDTPILPTNHNLRTNTQRSR